MIRRSKKNCRLLTLGTADNTFNAHFYFWLFPAAYPGKRVFAKAAAAPAKFSHCDR